MKPRPAAPVINLMFRCPRCRRGLLLVEADRALDDDHGPDRGTFTQQLRCLRCGWTGPDD